MHGWGLKRNEQACEYFKANPLIVAALIYHEDLESGNMAKAVENALRRANALTNFAILPEEFFV